MTNQKTKKNEPLKNKAFELDPNADMEEGSAFWFKDVKLAVQGLLEEVEEAIKYYTIQNALNESKFRNERIEGLKIAKNLIKKWFPDVVKNENE